MSLWGPDDELAKIELGDRAALYWEAASWFTPSGLMMSTRNSDVMNMMILRLIIVLQDLI